MERIWEIDGHLTVLKHDGQTIGVVEEVDGGFVGQAIDDCWPDGEVRLTRGGPHSKTDLMVIVADLVAKVSAQL